MSDWRELAACAGLPITAAFPEDRHRMDSPEYRDEARAFRNVHCRQCPVRLACFTEGRTLEYGIWGGTTPPERRRIMTTRCACGAALDPIRVVEDHVRQCPSCYNSGPLERRTRG